jgi:hypothetical protein
LGYAVSTLSILCAALHFTAAAVVFVVLIVAVGANKRSSSALSLRLDRIDTAVAAGRVPASPTAPPSSPTIVPGTPWATSQQQQQQQRRQQQWRQRRVGDAGSGLERFDAVGFAGREGVHYGQTISGGGSLGGLSGGGGGLGGSAVGFGSVVGLGGLGGSGGSYLGGLGGGGLGGIAAEEGRKAAPRIVVYAASTPKGINLGGAGGGGLGEL